MPSGIVPTELASRGAPYRRRDPIHIIDTPQIWRPRRDPLSVLDVCTFMGPVYELQTEPNLDLKYFIAPSYPVSLSGVLNVRWLCEITVLITRARVIDPHAERSVCLLRRVYPDVSLA